MNNKIERLEILKQDMVNQNLPLKSTAHNLVFGKGNPYAGLMLIGEAPGEKEDLSGKPFVGSAGKVLDRLLAGAGLTIDDVYVTSIVKYRPPKNRNPAIDEIKAHAPYLLEQMSVIQPRLIVTMGNFSTKLILSGFRLEKMRETPGIAEINGQMHSVELHGVRVLVLPTYHPAAVLYRQDIMAKLVESFRKIKNVI